MCKAFLAAILIAFFVLPVAGANSAPMIAFSDLINGPKSGLGDSLGEGAIVTIWGHNFGSTQGASKVYVKDSLGVSREAAHVYYWRAAQWSGIDGDTSWPAHFGMYEIAFSIPSASADGAGKIYVTVGAETSNEMDFYIRSTGSIYFFSPTGSDSAAGTYSAPRLTINTYTRSSALLAAGDIIYTLGTWDLVGTTIQHSASGGVHVDGSANNHIALVVYPGAKLAVTTVDNYSAQSNYWVISKVETESNSMGLDGISNGRLIGCNVHGNGTGAFSTAQVGMIDAGAKWYVTSNVENVSNLKVFGCYMHDSGKVDDNKAHPFYIYQRSRATDLHAPEIAWNYLKNNEIRQGIHYYDEGYEGDDDNCPGNFVDTYKVHHNVVEDQVGPGIDVTIGGGAATAGTWGNFPVEIYNNLLINCGLIDDETINDVGPAYALTVFGERLISHVKIYNNTIYGYGYTPLSQGGAIYIPSSGSNYITFGGTYEFVNNIVVDTKGFTFEPTDLKTPNVMQKNVWYSSTQSPPAEDTDPITTNPNLVGGSPFDYRLSASSTNAIGAGYDASALVTDDLRGMLRGVPLDIGAFEYAEGEAVPTPTPTPTPATHRSMGAKPGLLP